MVTDFSGEYKFSFKFCTMVYGRPVQKISHFGELCSNMLPHKSQIGRISQCASASADTRTSVPFTCTVREIARRVDIESACVDIPPFRRRTYLLSAYADIVAVCTATDFSAENNSL